MGKIQGRWRVSLSLGNLFLLGLCILIGCASIWAAINRGSIRGTVTDPQGGVIPQVVVTITDTDTGVQTPGQTDSAGFFLFPELVPGNYTVHFGAKGFVEADVNQVVVKPNEVSTVDMQLRLGATAQHVEVTATNPLVETSATNVGTGVAERYVEDLPILGRDTQALVNLVPGVTSTIGPPGTLVGFNGGAFGGFPDPTHLVASYISVNGNMAGTSQWYLDGNLNVAEGQDNEVVALPPDAVAEFQTINTNFAAEYGRVGGAVFSQVSKSGTNNVHGDLYSYNRNSYFSARNPMAPLTPFGQVSPPNYANWNQFGGTIGGPVDIPHVYNGKNKVFFFAAWDISLLHEKGPYLASIPTGLEHSGDFSEFPSVAEYGLYDPMTTKYNSALGVFTRKPFLNPNGSLATSIPASRIDPIAQWYMNQYPTPNFLDPRQQNAAAGGCLNTCNNYEGNENDGQTTHDIMAKIDVNINDRNKLFVEYVYNPSYYTMFKLPWASATAPLTGFNGAFPWTVKNQLATLGETHTFSSTLVNEVRFTYTRQHDIALPMPGNLINLAGQLTEDAHLNIPVFPPLEPTPSFAIGNAYFNTTASNASVDFGQPDHNEDNPISAVTLLDNITKVVGKHTLKAGGMWRTDWVGTVWTPQPTLTFASGLTSNPTTGAGGDAFAQFLLGTADQGSNTFAISPTIGSDRYAGAYVQDDFRITPKFTLNFGLRWDFFGWWNDRHNNAGNYALNTPDPIDPIREGAIVYMGTPQHPSSRPYPGHYNSFGPRINFSYSPFADGKTVIRGGIDQVYINDMTNINGPLLGASELVGFSPSTNWDFYDLTGQGLYGTNQVPAFTLSGGAPSLPSFPNPRKVDNQWNGLKNGGMNGLGELGITHDPYMFLWNIQLQRELPGGWMISASYVGDVAHHLYQNGNARSISYVSTANKLQYKSNINHLVATPADLVSVGFPAQYYQSQFLLPYPQWTYAVNYSNGNTNMNYNGLQMKIEKRFSHGFDVLAAYSAQKTLGTGNLGNFMSGSYTGGVGWNKGRGRMTQLSFGSIQNPDNIAADYSLASEDTPQILNTVFSYTLPFGPGRAFASGATGIMRHLVQGWMISGNFNTQSGIPETITGPGNNLTSRVDLIGDPNAGRSSKSRYALEQQWYNPNAFEAVFGSDPATIALATTGTPAQKDAWVVNGSYPFWRFGTAGQRLGNARMPGFWNLDTSIGKAFLLTENKRLEFRANAFNAFNHQNLGTPNTTWCLGPNADGSTDAVHQFGCQFGRITTVQTDPRAWQFSLKFVF